MNAAEIVIENVQRNGRPQVRQLARKGIGEPRKSLAPLPSRAVGSDAFWRKVSAEFFPRLARSFFASQ